MYLAFLGVVLLQVVESAEVQPFNGLPLIDAYDTEELGASPQNWESITDTNGVLYVANQGAVLKYDGVSWRSTSVSGRPASIAKDGQGRIFIGGANDFGYLRPSESPGNINEEYVSLRRVLVPDSIQFDRVFNTIAHNGLVYFQSNTHLFRYDGESIEVFRPPVRFQGLGVIDDKVVVKSSGVGLLEVRDDELTLIENGNDPFFRDNFIEIMTPYNDKVLICTRSTGCVSYRHGTVSSVQFRFNPALISRGLYDVEQLNDGTLLFGTLGNGLVQTDTTGAIIRTLNKDDGLLNNTILDIFEDEKGLVWVSSNSGVNKLELGIPLAVYDERVGIPGIVWFTAETQRGFIISTSEGVFIRTGKGLEKVENITRSCLSYSEVSDGIFFGCNSTPFFLPENSSRAEVFGREVSHVQVFNEDQTWFATANMGATMHARTDTSIEKSITFDEVKSRPNSLLVDSLSNIWVGSPQGVYQIRVGGDVSDYTVRHYGKTFAPGFGAWVTVSLLHGAPTFFTNNGLYVYDSNTDSIVPDERFGEQFADTTRQVFLGASKPGKVAYFSTSPRYEAVEYTGEGLVSRNLKGLYRVEIGTPAWLMIDRFNMMWLSTSNGVARYDPTLDSEPEDSFFLAINEITTINTDSLLNGASTKAFTIPYSDNRIRFSVAAATYSDPTATEYRYRLEGAEDTWTEWISEPTKDYTFIPEGEYTFQVQARNIYGVLSGISEYTFSVLPPWYRTWWAYVLYVMAVSGALYGIYLIRLNQILKEVQIRNRIAADLHDEVSATLSSISFFAHAVDREQPQKKSERFVKLILESANDAKEKISDIVWAINPEHDDWETFLAKCRRYTVDILESREMKHNLKIDVDLKGKMKMEFRQHLWMIFKEVVTNSVRHADASRLDIILTNKSNTLVLIVQDDGKGFSAELDARGNGINNIYKRAELIRAKVDLNTAEGFGTRWNLEIPV
ncbi:MAG: triple tyrosine motif-containing protein [Bacteroidota bacterium]